MTAVTAGRDVRARTAAHVDQEARRFARRTRAVMALEGALAVGLGGAGVVSALGTGAATVTVAGVRLGLPQFAVLAAIGVLILVSLGHPVALRRVAVVAATVATAGFVAGGVHHPAGVWDVDLAGIAVLVVIALAGFVEFVLLGSADFVSEPSDPPHRPVDAGGGGTAGH